MENRGALLLKKADHNPRNKNSDENDNTFGKEFNDLVHDYFVYIVAFIALLVIVYWILPYTCCMKKVPTISVETTMKEGMNSIKRSESVLSAGSLGTIQSADFSETGFTAGQCGFYGAPIIDVEDNETGHREGEQCMVTKFTSEDYLGCVE